MGAIVAHRAPEKDEWRNRIYNNRDPTKIKGSGRKRPGKKEKGPGKRRKALGMREELGILILERGVPSP